MTHNLPFWCAQNPYFKGPPQIKDTKVATQLTRNLPFDGEKIRPFLDNCLDDCFQD